MATIISSVRTRSPIAVDPFEKLLSVGAVMLLACVAVAVARGAGEWARVPALIWLHLVTIVVALALTPVILLRPRGDARHRSLGRIWAGAMIATAALSLGIRTSGHFSVIHLLSLFTLVQVPLIWRSAKQHQVVRHRRAVRAMVTGALLVAGFFTFPFDRLLGHWLFAGW